MNIYLDNAATTPIDPEVVEEMIPYMRDHFGNPSSTHSFGRKCRAAIELARKRVAEHIGASPGEIIFTSGGTEADNMAIECAIRDFGITHAITSKIEHHAVLYPLEKLAEDGRIKLSYVKTDELGRVDLAHLRELLENNDRSFVSLMHANNEIGNLLPIEAVGDLCDEFGALFHADTVQTIAHYPIDASKLKVHFMTCAAHKFHGPKGVGFLYLKSDIKIKPLIRGGSQERNMRAGTENVYGIMGLAKALDLAYDHLDEHRTYISNLRTYFKERLLAELPGTRFHGDVDGPCLYTVLSVCLPKSDKAEMLLFNLDIDGIATSGGSACSSGSSIGSHVLAEMNAPIGHPAVRLSFSKFNTKEEVDYTMDKLKAVYEL